MTPHLGSRLTIHESDVATRNLTLRATPRLRARPPEPRHLTLVEGGEFQGVSSLQREAFQRRLLAVADVLAAMAALWLVLRVAEGHNAPALAALAGMPLVVLVFKIAGLYDRDQLRVTKS